MGCGGRSVFEDVRLGRMSGLGACLDGVDVRFGRMLDWRGCWVVEDVWFRSILGWWVAEDV